MGKIGRINLPQDGFTAMTKWCVAQIVPQGDRFGQILVQKHGPGDVARHLGNFQGMRQPCAVDIPQRVQEDLGFVFQPSKCIGVNDAIPITLKGRADRAG